MVENSRLAGGANETGISGQHNNLYNPDDNVSMASKSKFIWIQRWQPFNENNFWIDI